MKALLVISIIIILSGCTRKSEDPFFQWENTDAVFDTLTRDLDKAWATGADADSLAILTSSLQQLANNDSVPAKSARAHYFIGRWHSAFSTYHNVIPEMRLAEKLYGDSASFPYAFNRIKYVLTLNPGVGPEQRYFDNLRLLRFFDSEGDSVMATVARTNIGNVLLNLGDTVGARPYFENALRSMKQLGMDEWVLKFSLPMAQICRNSDRQRSDSIISELLRDKSVRADSAYCNIVLHIAFLLTNDIKYIKEAYPLVEGKNGYNSVEGLYESYIAKDLLERGIGSDSMLILAESARSKLDKAQPSTLLSVTNTCARVYDATGMRDSALSMYVRYTQLMDSTNRLAILNNVQKSEIRQKIILAESNAREQRLKERMGLGMTTLAILIASSVAITLLYRRSKRLEIQKIRTELELTRNRLQLASSAVVMEEKDKVIESVMDTIETMKREGKVNPNDANLMNSAIKVHKSNSAELASFQEIHEKLDPGFQIKLKADFPSLSENNIKIASYIAIGMNNRQIARVMSIDYKSVITARHRLRSKMSLAKENSLEDALRKYMSRT